MCLLCSDQNAYRAYMDYVEARLRKGQKPDAGEAAQAVCDELKAAARRADAQADDPANDKTLSPFFCSPINR